MAIQNLYPSIKPSLNLNFANTKTLDPRITFSRASTATFYDGKTFAKAEENLLRRSQEFDDATWSKTAVTVTANSTIAPDGQSDADTVTAIGGLGSHYVLQGVTLVSGVSYTISVYAKAGSSSFLQITLASQVGTYANFDLTGGATGTSAGVTSSSIQSVGSGWYRCVVIFSNTNATSTIFSVASSSSDTRLQSWTATGTETVYIWGAQLEARPQITAYTPTTSQPITNYIPVLQTAAADVARFDHNPVTGESLGLLIEESRTNLLLNSSTLTGVNTSGGAREGNQLVAPDGSVTASIFSGTGSVPATWNQSATATASKMTYSVFVKTGLPSSRTSFAFLMRNNTTAVNFNTGVFSSVTGNITGEGWSSTHVGNGWYRIAYTNSDSQIISVGNPISCYFGAAGGPVYATSDRLGLWGAQLEAASLPSSYIKTEASQVTRAADNAVMTGTNFSSWFSQAEGTLYAEINPRALAASSGVILNDNTTNNRIRLATTSTSDQGTVTVGGTAQATLDGGTPVINTDMKLAMAYKANDFALSLNGGAVVTETVGTVPVVTQMQIGAETTTRGNLHIKKVAFYPRRLSDANIQAITT